MDEKEPLTPARDPWESLAFQFCKIATFALVFQRYTLLAAVVLAMVGYWIVVIRGVRSTRCWLKKPILVALFWTSLFPIVGYYTFISR